MNSEQLEPSSSPASDLALSNIKEGMGHNAERAQELQQELAQRMASLHQDSVEAQGLQGKEALLANIKEEEMAHQTQVLVLSHLHLQQAEEIKSQSDEIRHLSTLLEKQQSILEKVQEQQRRMPEMPVSSTTCMEELQREAFNILAGMVNARQGAALAHASGISQDILVMGRPHFENELVEEATWASCSHPHHVTMCILLLILRRDLHLPPKNILQSIDQQPYLILPHIHLDMR